MSYGNKSLIEYSKSIAIVIVVAFGALSITAKLKKKDSVYENEQKQKNSMEGKKVIFVENSKDAVNADGVCGHLEVAGKTECQSGFYDNYVKRIIDIIFSFAGLIILSPVFLGVATAIKIDDPGPVFFVQKRVGKNKQYFKLHKFRSMKISAPHDVPTHMLGNSDLCITKVGRFMRRYSIDELPQLWDIFIGNMSIIGPRPALWNQDVLVAERDKWGANDIRPGLTGWAQINGRDEIEIPIKAKLDGEYCEKIGVWMDIKCFLGTISSVLKQDGVVEGGTGSMKKSRREHN